ncbi:MAG TPA: HAMP domain-containing sensor histidine kinase [Acidimicrobiales bacterium]|nr:HAMP domain-containing sensor histidine kinase [Acidimicrobiales bacterium]
MRARLTTAIVLLVLGTLVLTTAGGLYLIRGAARDTAERQLADQATALAAQPRLPVAVRDLRSRRLIQLVGQYGTLSIAGLSPAGAFDRPLPVDVSGSGAVHQLLAGRPVSGGSTHLVYVLVPLALTAAQKAVVVPPVAPQDEAVLVTTRHVALPASGLAYFALVGLAVLAVAAGVASWLAHRFARPLRTAAAVTERIAGGDLRARMQVAPDTLPEAASLAAAINVMGESLEAARHQQRQFLLSVSHELRTPLTSIVGYADALAEGATDDVAGATAVIGAEARRLERLVQDLLDLARLDARRFSLHPEPLDVSELVARTVDNLAPTAQAASLDLRADTEGAAWAMADPDRLVQLLSNLVENACRYARHAVVAGARAEGPTVWLWVADDGPGIAPGDLPRVFEPHFSSDSAPGTPAGSAPRRARPGLGTGLGLAIVAELAAAMGGGVRAESPTGPDGGARLVVWLPAAPPRGPGAQTSGSGRSTAGIRALEPPSASSAGPGAASERWA